MDINQLALAIRQYGVEPVVKKAKEYVDQQMAANPLYIVDANGQKQYNPEITKQAMEMVTGMAGGVNFLNKGGQFIRVAGKMAGSTPAVVKQIPYFGEKGSNVVQDAIGHLRVTNLPKAPVNQASYIPLSNQGKWIRTAEGQIVRTDLPVIK